VFIHVGMGAGETKTKAARGKGGGGGEPYLPSRSSSLTASPPRDDGEVASVFFFPTANRCRHVASRMLKQPIDLCISMRTLGGGGGAPTSSASTSWVTEGRAPIASSIGAWRRRSARQE
jgi:hypothetical protein